MKLRRHTQRILADPRRGDGHDHTGTPGDCLRACLAGILGQDLDAVPHIGLYVSWFAAMRQHVRATTSRDLAYWDEGGRGIIGYRAGYGIGAGRSPRGPFQHAVIVDLETGGIVWDPHPSRAGLAGPLLDVVALVPPWPFPPSLGELTA